MCSAKTDVEIRRQDFKKYELEMDTYMAREEIQVSKIRELIKDRPTQPNRKPQLQGEES